MSRGGRDLVWLLVLIAFLRKHQMTLAALRELARSVGFPNPDLAAAVAMAESDGNAMAVGDVTRGFSIGLWQINLRAHPEYNAVSLYDPNNNAQAAMKISSGGTNWKPWSTFNSGAYKKYLPKPAEPASPANV